jgi:alanine racemase
VRAAGIDLAALARNIRSLTDALGVDRSLVDLRASAYGHGLVAVARASTAAGATALRVSSVADAIGLRNAGVECDVYAPDGGTGFDARLLDGRLLDGRVLDETAGSADDSSPRDLGAGVYGLDPSAPVATTAVMTLRAEVIAVKRVRAGTGVSYGYTYRAPDDTSIALVSIGYADGVPRLASNTTEAELAGAVHRVVGRIAMDQLVLDIGHSPARAGDIVTIFGDRERGLPTALDWALATRRSPLALTAGLGRRVVRTHS